MKLPVFILFFTISLFTFNASVSAQTVYHTLTGHVHDAKTNEVLTGATVVLDKTTFFSVTDTYGGYQIGQLPVGSYRFKVNMLGYSGLDTVIDFSSKQLHIDFHLRPVAIDLKAVEVVGDVLKTGQKESSLNMVIADKSFLEKNYGNTLSNTLEKIPGLSAMNTGVGISKPVIRGLYGNRVVVNDLGIKQEGQQWGTDHGLEIDQFNVEKVAVVKGAASLQYGSDAMGGVINIVALPPPTTARGLTGEVNGFYRQNNAHLGTSLALAGNKKHHFFKARYSAQAFADYRVPASEFTYNGYVLPIYNRQLKNTAGKEQVASFVAGTGGRWGSLQGSVSRFYQHAGFFVGAIGIPRAYQLEPDGDNRNIALPNQSTEHWKAILNGKLVFRNQSIQTDLGFQHNLRREESFPHLHGLGSVPSGNLAHEMRLSTFSLNTRYNRYSSNNLKTTIGMSAQLQENRRGGFEFLLPDYLSFQTGLFTTVEQSFSQKMSLNAGLRMDYGLVNIERFAVPLYLNDSTISGYVERVPNIDRYFYNYSAAVGFSFYPNEGLQGKVNLGKSFRLPAPVELGQNGVHHGTFRHEQGNPNLNSENGYQLDVSLGLKRSHWMLEVSPFFNYFQNYIYLRPSGMFSLLPDAGQIYQYTQANAIHTGFEWQLEYHPLDAIHLETNAQYVYNLNVETGLPLPFTSPFSVYNQADYTLEKAGKRLTKLFFAAEHQWVAQQNRTDRNEAATPGYHLFHFATGFTFQIGKQSIQLTGRVQNLLDKAYLNHLSRFRILNLPEQGRNFLFTVKIPIVLVG